jgi:MATE family multidrug resistance protein
MNSIRRKIFHLAVPNIVSNVTVPLLGIVDIALLGHDFTGEGTNVAKYVGALALGSVIFSLIYSGLSFLRMGTTGFTAQSFGKRDLNESFYILIRSLAVGLFLSVILIILQFPIASLGFGILEGSKTVESYAIQYFYIRIYAAPATLSLMAFNGWFIGMQNTRFPMIIAIAINVFNILISSLLVIGFNMNVEGVAYGTVISNYIGLSLALFFFYRYYKKIARKFNRKKFLDINKLKMFFSVNGNIFIRTILLIFIVSFFTSESAKFGENELAANTVLFQFFYLFSYFMDGFAYSAEALVGKYTGAGSFNNLKRTIIATFKIGAVLSLIFSLIYFFAGEELMRIFTDDEKIIRLSQSFIIWTIIIPVLSFSSFLWDGIYLGATAAKGLRNIMILSVISFFILYYLFVQVYQNHALWGAFTCFLFLRGLFQTVFSKKYIFHIAK